MIEAFGHFCGPKLTRWRLHEATWPPLYLAPFGNSRKNFVTIGWFADPSAAQLIAALSLTPWGWLGVPALFGVTAGLTVTAGHGLAASATVAPAARTRPATAAITSFRI